MHSRYPEASLERRPQCRHQRGRSGATPVRPREVTVGDEEERGVEGIRNGGYNTCNRITGCSGPSRCDQ